MKNIVLSRYIYKPSNPDIINLNIFSAWFKSSGGLNHTVSFDNDYVVSSGLLKYHLKESRCTYKVSSNYIYRMWVVINAKSYNNHLLNLLRVVKDHIQHMPTYSQTSFYVLNHHTMLLFFH